MVRRRPEPQTDEAQLLEWAKMMVTAYRDVLAFDPLTALELKAEPKTTELAELLEAGATVTWRP